MLNKLISTSLIGSALFIGTASADEPVFNFVSFSAPGAVLTEFEGINPSGDMAGLYVDSSNVVHSFVLRKGEFTSVDYPGAAYTDLRAVAPGGDIVANYAMPSENHSFVLTRGERRSIFTVSFSSAALAPYPGHPHMIAQRILPDGSVLGCFHDHDYGLWMRGFVLRDGTYTGPRWHA